MTQAKYKPEEVDRMIEERISLIEASNSVAAAAEALRRAQADHRSPLRKLLDSLWHRCRLRKRG